MSIENAADRIYVVRRHHPEHRPDDKCTYSESDAEKLKQEYLAEGYINADYDSYTHPEFLQLGVKKTGLKDIQEFDYYLLDKYQCPIHGEIRIRNTPAGTIIISPINSPDEQFEMKVTSEELSRWHFLRTAWENRDNLEWFEKFRF
jgi:hypothetical protein